MRASDSPFATDWFVVSLRWLTILGLVVSLAMSGLMVAAPTLLLLGLVGWNIVLTVLAGLSRRLNRHREISLVIDLVVAGLYFGLSGGFLNPAFWVGLIPILSAALYFEMRGALISAGLVALTQVAVTLLQTLSPKALFFPAVSALLTFLLAGVFGFLSQRLIHYVHQMQQTQLEGQQKKKRLENERMRAIYNLTSTLLATLNYQRVLDSVLDLSLGVLNPDPDSEPDDRLISAVLLFNPEEQLEVGSARRFTPADLHITLPAAEGAIAMAIEEGEPTLITDISHDPELSRIVSLHTCLQIYCFPLRSGFNVYGVLIFGHPVSEYFTADRREVLDILGSQAIIAIQNSRLYQDLVDERDRMIEVQEEARKKLARDLHDGPTQSVSAVTMRVNMARRMLEKDPQAASDELGRIEELARRTSKEIRHMLFTLRPLVLESQGLVAALQSMAEKMKEMYSQSVTVNVDENLLKDFEMGKQGVVFYIVEEAITNARKHAQAAHIWVRMRPLDQGIALLEIQDDGIGFDVESVTRAYDKRGSLGMINLRERAELVNGLLHIQSAPGQGTKVEVFIPLTEEAADRLHHPEAKR